MTFNLMTVLVLLAAFLASSVKILREYERGVVFRLGRIIGAKGPGLIILIPGIDKMVKVDLRTVTLDVPPQDIITRDNVSVKVSAVVYFRVLDAIKAIVDVADFHFATSQLAQTTLRSVSRRRSRCRARHQPCSDRVSRAQTRRRATTASSGPRARPRQRRAPFHGAETTTPRH